MASTCDQSRSPFGNTTSAGVRKISSLRSASEPHNSLLCNICGQVHWEQCPGTSWTAPKIDFDLRVLATHSSDFPYTGLLTLRRYSPHCSSRSSQSVARRTLRHRNGRTYEFLKQSLINFVACLPGPPREAERDRSGVPKTALSKAVGAVAGFVHATNSNTACQMSASFQAHTPGLFPTICSTRGIADATSNWFKPTR